MKVQGYGVCSDGAELRYFARGRAGFAAEPSCEDCAGQGAGTLERIGRSPDEIVVTCCRDEWRILGDDRFLAGLKPYWRPRNRHSVDEHISRICAMHGVDPIEPARPGRHRNSALIRALIAHDALERRIASLSELARRFGRSAATLCEPLEHYRRASPAVFSAPLDLE